MIAAVVLAAGTSTRLGTPKQLLPYRGKPLIATVVQTTSSSRVDKTVVVLGHQAEEVREALKDFQISFVYNPDYAKGQSTSLKVGLTALSNSVDAALFVLGDQPLLQPDTVNRIIKEYSLCGRGMVAPFYRGQRGNPVLFDRIFFPKIEALAGDTGARKIIECYYQQLIKLAVDDIGIIFDIDTWEDYCQLISFE